MVLHDVLVVLVVLANVKVSIPKEMKKRERGRKEEPSHTVTAINTQSMYLSQLLLYNFQSQ